MHQLEQIQSYREKTSLGWGKFEVTTQVQGHHQGHTQCRIKVTLKVTSKIILEVIQGHFKVKLKNY